MNLAGKEVIIFDFDGTLIDSNQLKKDAFFQLRPEDTKFNKVIEEKHAKFPESSRYILLRMVLEEYGSEDIESEIKTLANRYGEEVENAAINCSSIDGAVDLLSRLKELKLKVYLSSNTPEESLKRIISKRDWSEFFKGVFGYPRKKDETIIEIFKKEKLSSPSQIVVLGDGLSDKNSAKSIECDFIDVNKILISQVLKETSHA